MELRLSAGQGGGDLVYGFIYDKCCSQQYAPKFIFSVGCAGCADKLTAHVVKDCEDTVGSCVVGPEYSSSNGLQIVTGQSYETRLKRKTPFYLVIDSTEPGLEMQLEVMVQTYW